MKAVWDLYSDEILEKKMNPVFHSYYHVEYREGFFMQAHDHPRVEIMYTRKGCCDVYAAEKHYRLEAGDLILINGEVPHKLLVDKHTPCRVLCLEFDFSEDGEGMGSVLGEISQAVPEVRRFLGSAPAILKLKDAMEIYSHLVDIFHELEHKESGRNFSIRYAFGQLVIKLARMHAENEAGGNGPAEMYVRDAITFINNNYAEEIGVEEMAAHTKLNVSYFHKIFKKAAGCTPMDYLNNVRIDKAKMLLENTDIPIIEICTFVGFNSRQYFTHAFKKRTGLTPRAFRQIQQRRKGPGWHRNS